MLDALNRRNRSQEQTTTNITTNKTEKATPQRLVLNTSRCAEPLALQIQKAGRDCVPRAVTSWQNTLDNLDRLEGMRLVSAEDTHAVREAIAAVVSSKTWASP